MAKKHHEEHDEEHENSERWLLTYADMITLLMVLFIVLFAMGTTDTRKFNAFKQSFKTTFIGPAPVLRGGVGVLNAANTVSLAPTIKASDQAQNVPKILNTPLPNNAAAQAVLAAAQAQAAAAAAEQQTLSDAKAKIQAALAAAGLADQATYTMDAHGLTVTIATDKVLFNIGSAQLLPEGLRVIDAIAPTLASLPNQISIAGHTDNQPISSSQYPTNWELSTARATAVLRYLIDAHGMPPDRVSASGYADTRPLVPDTSPANQAKNRRVEVIIEPTTISN